MNDHGKIVELYSGDEVTIQHLKQELEAAGIATMLKDGFNQGNAAGFVGGTPSVVELLVNEKDLLRAQEILKTIQGA
ncbi:MULTISPECIES: putative signal transducing protein [Draconibacterium]|uniref:DUF2007 domain-containing protein n=1 Tax=Draconibacterium sediminis TaxID=1544798 RepID=A0A0D8JDI1_9BACT|nr:MULTISPECIES: DUF2007 domain-containing protein [Draconibacterium]KJF44995.1 hypothetical protein LH29_06140 [Draconibacterium sediminis]